MAKSPNSADRGSSKTARSAHAPAGQHAVGSAKRTGKTVQSSSGSAAKTPHSTTPRAANGELKNGGRKAEKQSAAEASNSKKNSGRANVLKHRSTGKPATPPANHKAAPAKPASKSTAKSVASPKEKKQNELTTKILHMIAEEMAVEEAELTPTASFKEDLNLDNLDVTELLMQAESSFNVHPFNEDDWERCETVDDFVTLVQKRVEARRAKKPAGRAARD